VKGSDSDVRTHSLSVGKVKDLIESIEDVDELKALLAGEFNHPEYSGGRKGALIHINSRIEELSS
jgi:hypothetical protein